MHYKAKTPPNHFMYDFEETLVSGILMVTISFLKDVGIDGGTLRQWCCEDDVEILEPLITIEKEAYDPLCLYL